MNEKPLIMNGFPIFARTKHGYFGGYPAGFLERARILLTGPDINRSIWHIPGGNAHLYNGAGKMPLKGFGPKDIRIDINPACSPDILMDINKLHELNIGDGRPDAILIDRPYTEEYHDEYKKRYGMPNCDFPSLSYLLKESIRIVKPYGMVGIIDYQTPVTSGMDIKNIYRFSIDGGNSQRARIYSQYMRMSEWEEWKNA